MFAIANGRKALWQWDLNQQLTVAGSCTEVHYLDKGSPSTLTVAVKDGKADIPNILLQKAGRLIVYAYIIDAQDHHTKVCETFGIAPRPKPDDYVYTETEVKTWSDLQSQIGNLADLATEKKDNLVAAINEAAASGGGGAGAWYVTLTPDDDGNITADKTMAEIEAAYQAGYAVYCIILYPAIFTIVPVIAPLTIHRQNTQYVFCGVGTFDSKLYSFQFELTESGWTVLQKEIPQKSDIPAAYILPKATANALGGVKADPATTADTQPVRINDSGKLVTAAGGAGISLGITSAAVGQTIKVKAVNEQGMPTAWEAAAGENYTLHEATSDALGGVKADPAMANDTQPVRIGTDGKLVTAPAAVSDTQVSSAVSTWLTEHPEATTTVQDGTVTDAKLSDDLYKQVMGDERHKLTEVEVTPIPQAQGGADWVAASFDGSGYKVVTTFFTPLAKTPRYIKVVNKTSATTIALRSGHTKYRFANGADESAEGFAVGNGARNLQFFNNIQIAPGETLLYDLQEFGRKGCEYFQFIISPANIGGAYTDAQFSAKLREQAEFYYVYDSYVPTYRLPDDSGEFLIDLPVRYVAQGINNTSTTGGFAVVPYYPNTTYNVRGGAYYNSLVNTLSVLFLLDDAIFNGRDNGITFNSGDCGHIPLIIGSSTTQYDTSVNGGADSKYQWAYVKTPPASELVGPKYVAIQMMSVSQDDATAKGEEYYKAIFDALNEKGPQNTYITRFSKQIPRSLYAQLAFPNPNYHDDGSKYYAMLTSASKSPLVGASWVLFGDSLTDNYGGHDLTGNYFATKIAREFNMSFDNRAKSGSNIYRGGSGNYTSVSGMIKLDEFTAEIDAGTTEQPDYITIAFGTNSFTAQLGTNADTSATDTSVYGATKRFIEVLREKCPKSVFGFVLSPKQNWGSSDPYNLRAVDAARTAIKAVCDEYGVPYIDMSTQSGITVDMLPDGIHISNDQSQNLYYHAMRRFMIGL